MYLIKRNYRASNISICSDAHKHISSLPTIMNDSNFRPHYCKRWMENDPRIIISNCHCVPRHESGGLFSLGCTLRREHLEIKKIKKKKRMKIWREENEFVTLILIFMESKKILIWGRISECDVEKLIYCAVIFRRREERIKGKYYVIIKYGMYYQGFRSEVGAGMRKMLVKCWRGAKTDKRTFCGHK